MTERDRIWLWPESLRERALWYRDFARANPDAQWALWIASRLEQEADRLEGKDPKSSRPARER
jgi:hypothetical protein